MKIFFRSIAERLLAYVAALIMLQTLYFKFNASEESVFIFSTLNMEPWGRIGSGIAELIASILLIIPRTAIFGAILGILIMTGAIAAHIFFLGIEVQGDNGYLFFLGLITLLCCSYVIMHRKDEVHAAIRNFSK